MDLQARGVDGELAGALHRARALLDLGLLDEAEREYAGAVGRDRASPAAQYALARLRYMRGDTAFARDLVAQVAADRSNGPLQLELANVLRLTGDLAGSEVLLRDLIARAGPLPALRSSLATVLHEAGRLAEAEIEARAALASVPTDTRVLEILVAVLLSRGRADEALSLARGARRRAPLDNSWIAHEATAARLAGDSAYESLYDYERFVAVYDLEPPSGWSSMTELNAALESTLRARHRLARPPFDQSVRFGSQTMGNLLAVADPAIQAAVGAFRTAIDDYRARLGDAVDHPLSARNRGEARLTGGWSIQLERNGFHVNHLHPGGWLSSAYYVAVPAEVDDASTRSGWLKFGEPALPVPGASPARTIQPKPGRLVLFPSYLWHGTTVLHGTEQRLTIAFDVSTATAAQR